MAEQEDKELKSIKQVIESLEGLEPEARTRVLEYVFRRLGMTWQPSVLAERQGAPAVPSASTAQQRVVTLGRVVTGPASTDIRTLKDEKQPRSANQMAALVAFYLSDLAQPPERKPTVGTADIVKYFKQANFKLPKRPDQTLPNAKNAGYFDYVGDGNYKLNPVGYNLVVHSLPSGGGVKKAPRKSATRVKSSRRPKKT